MQVRTSAPQIQTLAGWLLAALGVALLVVLLLSFMADDSAPPAGSIAGTGSPGIVYLQFGKSADTLYATDPDNPSQPHALYSIAHAPDYGIVPSVSPAGDRFVFTALPAELSAPSPQSQANLWLAGIAAGEEPRMISEGADLRVAPVWTPDGRAVVFRRSTPEASVLALTPIEGGDTRALASSPGSALFPAGFTPEGDSLYYVAVGEQVGSTLMAVDLAGGEPQEASHLSDGLTRDWALSPDGTRLAYLEVSVSSAETASRAYLLDISTGSTEPLTTESITAFGPVWSSSGTLAVGAIDERSGEAALVTVAGGEKSQTLVPATGFDVPLAFAPGGAGYLARSFENESVTAPGRSTLTLVGADGARQPIASGEVTFVGWTHH